MKADVFHVTRDAELAIQELEAEDLLESIQEAVWRRRFRDAVRLQIKAGMPQKLIDIADQQSGAGSKRCLSRGWARRYRAA